MEANEALVAILKKSHAQAVAGQTVEMDVSCTIRYMNFIP